MVISIFVDPDLEGGVQKFYPPGDSTPQNYAISTWLVAFRTALTARLEAEDVGRTLAGATVGSIANGVWVLTLQILWPDGRSAKITDTLREAVYLKEDGVFRIATLAGAAMTQP